MLRTCSLVCAMIAVGADAPKDEASAADLKKMQGDWAAVSMVRDGMKFPDDDAQGFFRTVMDNTYSVAKYSRTIGKGTKKIDATKNPRTIDSIPAGPQDKVKPVLGIYAFDGATQKICNAAPGMPRPTAFESKEGSGHTLIVWQREKQ